MAPNGTTQPDRTHFQTSDNISHIWTGLGLPNSALASLNLQDDGTDYASSYKIADLAQSSIALSALSASLVDSLRQPSGAVKRIKAPRRHACLEFQTERLFSIDGDPSPSAWGPIGGLHATADGHVRIHDVFPHHRNGALRLLGLDEKANRADVAEKVKGWKKVELEEAACEKKLVIYALRSYAEWDALPHSAQVSDFPILLRKIGEHGPKGLSPRMKPGADRCLRGLRVLELSRVIAAPTAGKTLAAHGADVLWVTSPNLPDLPHLDRNLSRGKRTIQLDLHDSKDVEKMRELVKECDVFIQGYRPQSLAAKGFSAAELAALRPGLIYANLSAFGPTGPWSDRRGFDSLVQTCTGMNVSEAEHFGEDEAARVMPAQALDYGGGFLLATGICAALYRQATEGGSWEVHVSLAAVSKYLRSLGQRPGKTGFGHIDPADDAPGAWFEERESGFGRCRGLKHAADVEGATPGWDIMPKPLGSDEPRWL
ncbi:CoA-transferase family III [Neohortaea acidophila]|uniref:CoA-transferase family III n=1 Tax=Neohortaea acidophila TaxID=245834 RepID=A0A6A6PQ39_9PEZI|nr:CoA-transferase family III [Neohortaea acidophila]KAF2482045.1 CoA-transferase family III [Neohortaea acidophila]